MENEEEWQGKPATEAQRRKLFALLAEQHMDRDEFEKLSKMVISDVSRGDMSHAIDLLETSKSPVNDLGLWGNARNVKTEEKKEVAVAKKPDTVVKMQVGKAEHMAQFYGIPPELANMFFITLDGGLYIKQPGLLYLAGKKTYARILTSSKYNSETNEWEAETKIYPLISQSVLQSLSVMDKEMQRYIIDTYYGPTIGQGRASKENVKMSTMHVFLKEMAETRSANRALRLYTGYGGTSYEEMPSSVIDAEVPS